MTDAPPLHPLRLVPFDLELAVCRLPADHPVESWMHRGRFTSITRTAAELSVIVETSAVPPGITQQRPFAAFAVEGVLDFALTGLLARLLQPLADAGVPAFALSTYDTDYVLIRAAASPQAVAAWRAAGVTVS